ncbi:basic proline-rich protein-like [Camelus ferus]|uniref:Basic proline-rich protein-like n=1 Tax=Camelus ferus TaxID=419612 RepID=A0A8B8U912_CAMFR|nr:basic proline-rich protein-like [Camelus ferus]
MNSAKKLKKLREDLSLVKPLEKVYRTVRPSAQGWWRHGRGLPGRGWQAGGWRPPGLARPGRSAAPSQRSAAPPPCAGPKAGTRPPSAGGPGGGAVEPPPRLRLSRRRRRLGRAPSGPPAARRRSPEPPPPAPFARPPSLAAQRKHGGGQGVSRPAPPLRSQVSAFAAASPVRESPRPEGPGREGGAGTHAAAASAPRARLFVCLGSECGRGRPPPCQRAPSPGGAFCIRDWAGGAQCPARGPDSIRAPWEPREGNPKTRGPPEGRHHGRCERGSLCPGQLGQGRPESIGFGAGENRGRRAAWPNRWSGVRKAGSCQPRSSALTREARRDLRRDNSRVPPETGGESRFQTSDEGRELLGTEVNRQPGGPAQEE